MSTLSKRASGCLFGVALGDALGAPTEFIKNVAYMEEEWGKGIPDEPYGDPARVTDDTQMMLAVGEALAAAPQPYTAATLEEPLRWEFVKWMRSPDNDWAPGMTCMTACRNLMMPMPWQEATVSNSKGCGANMRVAPVGILPGIDAATRAGIAQFQAALTHGHPTGLAASDLTAFAIADLAGGSDPATLPVRLREYAMSQRGVYHQDWLGTLWQKPGVSSPEEFIQRGWEECLGVLDDLDRALLVGDRTSDPCRATGDGWVAEEAFGTGLLCFLLFPDDPLPALRRAAITSGDSDSIACLCGAFAGACHGLDAWPDDWLRRIEYRDRLATLGDRWDSPAAAER